MIWSNSAAVIFRSPMVRTTCVGGTEGPDAGTSEERVIFGSGGAAPG
jgi:hypothetical protein